jgi:IstB-like ATP binding protein
VQPHVLVVDEVGYLTYGTDAANVLFHVVNERYLKKRSMVFTTNKALKTWGKVLHDQDLGDAIVDRILERGRVIKLDGSSIRSQHVDPADLDGGDLSAIVSGTDRPDFPEPATCGAQTREVNRPSFVVRATTGDVDDQHRESEGGPLGSESTDQTQPEGRTSYDTFPGFCELGHVHGPSLLRWARSRSQHANDAWDLVQDAFERALSARARDHWSPITVSCVDGCGP